MNSWQHSDKYTMYPQWHHWNSWKMREWCGLYSIFGTIPCSKKTLFPQKFESFPHSKPAAAAVLPKRHFTQLTTNTGKRESGQATSSWRTPVAHKHRRRRWGWGGGLHLKDWAKTTESEGVLLTQMWFKPTTSWSQVMYLEHTAPPPLLGKYMWTCACKCERHRDRDRDRDNRGDAHLPGL